MNFHRVIRKVIRREHGRVRIAADINAVISGNTGGGSSHTHVSSRQTAVSGKDGDDRADHPDQPKGG
jgi:hypothetical protein